MNFEDARKILMDEIDDIIPTGDNSKFDEWIEKIEDLLIKHENYEEDLNDIINDCEEWV